MGRINEETREKILELVALEQGVSSYENIKTFDSLESVPENKYFFDKTEFYNVLKQQNVPDEEYENSKFLNVTLKIRNLPDMNDLYNFQGTCLLSEIIENRFKTMHKMHGFNPKQCKKRH